MKPIYRIGFTGSRHGMSKAQEARLSSFLVQITSAELRHGDCIGSDAQAHYIANFMGHRIVIHPANDPAMRAYCGNAFSVLPEKDALSRNHDIVDASDRLFATPNSSLEVTRSGTWATIRYARKKGIPITIIFPDGSFKDEFPWE